MNGIQVSYEAELDLLVFILTGAITRRDCLVAISTHFSEHPGSNTLWDVRGADLSEFNLSDMEAVSQRSGEVRKGPDRIRTALVVDSDGTRMLMRLFAAIASRRDPAPDIRSFNSVSAARHWIRFGGEGGEDLQNVSFRN